MPCFVDHVLTRCTKRSEEPIYRTSARSLAAARSLRDTAVHGYVRKLQADETIVGFLDDLFECIHRPGFYPLIDVLPIGASCKFAPIYETLPIRHLVT